MRADDMLAVGSEDTTRQLLLELAKDRDMRWGMETEMSGVSWDEQNDRWVNLRRCCCAQTSASVSSSVRTIWCSRKTREGDTRQLFGRLFWLDRPDIKNAVCQLSTHVGTAIIRDEANVP